MIRNMSDAEAHKSTSIDEIKVTTLSNKNKENYDMNKKNQMCHCDTIIKEEKDVQEEELHNIASSLLCTDEDMNEEPLLRVNSTNSLGSLVVEKTSLKISISECNQDNNTAAMTPLITPPSSPRRIRTLSVDGATTEEATICEWPCNLTVDNAITAALECSPTLYDERSSCEECGGRNFFAWMREVRLGSK